MLSRIGTFVKSHIDDIILLIGVVFISLLSFSAGFIVAKQHEKKPIRIEQRHEHSSQSFGYYYRW